MSEVKAGTKTAKAIAARFIESPKTQNMAIEVSFEFEEDGKKQTMPWQGWLNSVAKNGGPGPLESTMKTLVEVLGFNGNEAHDPTSKVLTDPKAFADREVQIVVDEEPYSFTNDNGDLIEGTKAKIKYVNALGGSGYTACTPQVIKTNLSNFKAAFLSAKSKLPASAQPQANGAGKKAPF